MFPSRDLPGIVNDENTAPIESNNAKESKKKRVFPLTISRQKCATVLCLILILVIIAVSILIGLLSVFIPKSVNDSSITPTAVTVALTLVLSITQNTSNILVLNNNSSSANNYLNTTQRNILKVCLQTRLNSDNRTKFMTIISIDSAHPLYSSIIDVQPKKGLRRKLRQILSSVNQVEITISVQCSSLTSKADCRQIIESVLADGEFLRCSLTDEIITTSSSSSSRAMKITSLTMNDEWRQVGGLFLAFGLTSLVGLERQLRGKSAGLRTHSIVGTTSALILQVSKYGFSDVIHAGTVVLDPSRIAAQIISGVSFLGAGLIITRQRAIRGLTTAASVWSAAAIGMAAGSGLWVLSLAVTGLHFVILLGFLPLEKRLPVFDKRSPFSTKQADDDDDNDDDDNQSV